MQQKGIFFRFPRVFVSGEKRRLGTLERAKGRRTERLRKDEEKRVNDRNDDNGREKWCAFTAPPHFTLYIHTKELRGMNEWIKKRKEKAGWGVRRLPPSSHRRSINNFGSDDAAAAAAADLHRLLQWRPSTLIPVTIPLPRVRRIRQDDDGHRSRRW